MSKMESLFYTRAIFG